MAPTNKKPKAKKYPLFFFRCGSTTEKSINKAVKDRNRKSATTLIRSVVEEWLQLNGYPVDPT